jgi:hypothetical protein
LKQSEAAGAHSPRYAAVQRWHLLRLDNGRALLLFGARISRQHEHRGHDRRGYDACPIAHAHVRLFPILQPPASPPAFRDAPVRGSLLAPLLQPRGHQLIYLIFDQHRYGVADVEARIMKLLTPAAIQRGSSATTATEKARALPSAAVTP